MLKDLIDLLTMPLFISWVVSLPFILIYCFSERWRKQKFIHSIVGVSIGILGAVGEYILAQKNMIGPPVGILTFLITGFIVGLVTQSFLSTSFRVEKPLRPRAVSQKIALVLFLIWQLFFMIRIIPTYGVERLLAELVNSLGLVSTDKTI